ncbi:MAG: propionyl-CoA carboxylase beta chain, partial [Pseudonocardiales bacterium]|nr:propionyl-CoA carboxylase beta chain [Pseudonocardiales bacterium]
SILYRKDLKELAGDELAAKRSELQQDYEDTLCNPYIAADRGYIDGVIPPSHTRGHVGRSLRLLATKREAAPARKHGNIPL